MKLQLGASYLSLLSHKGESCWKGELDNRKLVGAVLLDFSSSFDVIDHSLLFRQACCSSCTVVIVGQYVYRIAVLNITASSAVFITSMFVDQILASPGHRLCIHFSISVPPDVQVKEEQRASLHPVSPCPPAGKPGLPAGRAAAPLR